MLFRAARLTVTASTLLVLGGCTPYPWNQTPTPAPTATRTPSPSPRPAGTLQWTPCGTGFECATLRVPLDYAKPAAATIALALIRLPAALPAQRIGSLLTNPGGPGESGVDTLRQTAATLASATLRNRFDLISWDPRGVGASTPVTCLDGPQLERYFHLDPVLDDAIELQAGIQGAQQFDTGCQQKSGPLLPHLSTRDSARDIESIRAALGEMTISYLGFSYGTFLGAMYAHLYPTHVRAWVLDGAVDPNRTLSEVSRDQASGFEQNLVAFLKDCGAKPTCSYYNGGQPGAALDAFLARVDATPLVVGTRSIGSAEAMTAIVAGLYSSSTWGLLAQALAAADTTGDGSLMLTLFDTYVGRNFDGTYSNTVAANTAINCEDYAALPTVEAYRALADQLKTVSPHFGPNLGWSGVTCLYWPVPAQPPPGDLSATGAPTIVIVGATQDPATPYQWAQSLTRQIPGSVLVTRNGSGHVSYDKSACVRQLVDAYLVSKTVPAAGATC